MSDKQTPILRESIRVAQATAANLFVTAGGALPVAGGEALGPTYHAAAADEMVAVTALGTSSATAAGAFAAGALLEVTAAGKVRKRRSGVVVAKAMEAAAADGDTVAVFVVPNADANAVEIEISAVTKIHRFVKADGDAPAAGGHALGPVQAEAAASEVVPVKVSGPALAQISAAVAEGAVLEVLADGRVKTHDGNDTKVARALEAGAAANEIILVNLIPN